jgi:GT2 family glycosyltransferase
MPVYDDSRWLPGAIESVLEQDHSEWELIVGDNASTEPIRDVVARYPDPRIRYERFSRHVGIYENFNRTAHLARHEWVQVLAADDRLRPGCLERIATEIESWPTGNGELAMVLTACRRVDEHGDSADRLWYGSKPSLTIPPGVYDAAGWLAVHLADGNPPWNVGSVAVSRAVVRESGGWFRPEVGLSCDFELGLRAAAYGRVVYVDEPLLDMTVRPDADSSIRHWRNRSEGDPSTPRGIALAHALLVHESVRTVSSAERRRVNRTIARTHLQRAAQHRILADGQGRRGASRDIAMALRLSPSTVLRPYDLAYALASVLAPRGILARAQRRLAARHGAGS